MDTEFYNEQPQGLSINLESRDFLQNTAKWGKFLAIIGFVGVGIMVLFGVIALTMGASLGGGAISGTFLSLFYLLFAALYLLPVLYLYRFSSNMQTGLMTGDEETIAASFKNLKSLFKFMGVLTIVFLGFYALALLAMFFGVAIGSSI
ncbi:MULTISPECIES: hypothetical protein [Pontibacter]|uniref:DUF5362 domain-containing protein n=1 Tax=Pontibacter lucknowensis TaxID=1077936 RepID=A0A1N6V0I3_9BACT|nr:MULTISPECIES: hypothetical protein [Pontibacter]EJF09964.1 hypothetical protein O71_12021 [Pontibacter sp. BAB1700]SIQ71337.1 hypothetical protein SAMN05421545_1168 [Pontibacter lucknowensis]